MSAEIARHHVTSVVSRRRQPPRGDNRRRPSPVARFQRPTDSRRAVEYAVSNRRGAHVRRSVASTASQHQQHTFAPLNARLCARKVRRKNIVVVGSQPDETTAAELFGLFVAPKSRTGPSRPRVCTLLRTRSPPSSPLSPVRLRSAIVLVYGLRHGVWCRPVLFVCTNPAANVLFIFFFLFYN